MTSEQQEPGAPYAEVDAKRSFDNVPVSLDWHDYLINRRQQGVSVALNFVMRPRRADATGLQYKCTTAGVTSRMPWGRIVWPAAAGGTVTDGTAVWTAEPISASSLRTTIATQSFPAVAGVVLSSPSDGDLIYTTLVDGGTSGQKYEIKHQVILANGEEKEGVAVLPVQD